MIKFTGVTKSFQGVRALTSLDLEIPQGKTTVLLGTSGCGKSTILRLIVGLLRPDSGSIQVMGETIAGSVSSSVKLTDLRRRIGYVIQDGGLFPHLSAARNVALMADFLGWPKDKQDSRISQLSDLAQLDAGLLSKYPAQLSGGQRQRIGLMRALMLSPELLLLDEPLGALDPITRSELQQDLKRIFAAVDRTVVLVTHDLGEAFFLGDHIVLLHDGEIVQEGRPVDLLKHPKTPFVTRFVNAQRIPSLEELEAR